MRETAATEITPRSGRRPQEIWPLAPLCRNHGVGTLDRELIRSCRDGDVVTQLTFTILMQSFDKLQREDRLGSWLATVARRHTWRLLDSKRREGPSRDEALAGSVALLGKSDADHLERWELVEWLNDGLSLLDERCRDLLLAL